MPRRTASALAVVVVLVLAPLATAQDSSARGAATPQDLMVALACALARHDHARVVGMLDEEGAPREFVELMADLLEAEFVFDHEVVTAAEALGNGVDGLVATAFGRSVQPDFAKLAECGTIKKEEGGATRLGFVAKTETGTYGQSIYVVERDGRWYLALQLTTDPGQRRDFDRAIHRRPTRWYRSLPFPTDPVRRQEWIDFVRVTAPASQRFNAAMKVALAERGSDAAPAETFWAALAAAGEAFRADLEVTENQGPRPDEPPSGLSSAFGRRTHFGQAVSVMEYGGNGATENCVLLGLQWLARHQDDDGKWDGGAFMKRDPAANACTGPAALTWATPGLTGLATLAFLGQGNTHRQGTFSETVKKAVAYLIEIQAPNGRIGEQRGQYLYNHAICSLALVEAYGMTQSPMVRLAAQKSIEYLIAARNPGKAWRYGECDGDNDISVSGWCVLALQCARAAEVEVAGLDEVLREVGAWIESITDDSYGVSGYQARPSRGWQDPTSSRFQDDARPVDAATAYAAHHTPTAIATVCRVFLRYAKTDPRLTNGVKIVARMPPAWDLRGDGKPISTVDYYYWHFGTLAMFQVGGQPWTQWNKRMMKALVEHQHLKGAARGSWDPIDAWGVPGGRVYATAINVLTLEAYYRYTREPPPSDAPK